MSNPNLDSRYIKPADVDAKIAAQAVTDAGQYAPLGRDGLVWYVDARTLNSGAVAGQTPKIGLGIQSSGQTTAIVANGFITGATTGTTYVSPSSVLAKTPTVIGCDVAFVGTNQSMTLINSSDATILIANALHLNFGPLGFTLTARKDAGSFDVLLYGIWSTASPTDGATVRRYELAVEGTTAIIRGPNGEVFSVNDPRVSQLTGTLPIFEPNYASVGNQAFMLTSWAAVRDTTKQPTAYVPIGHDAAGGITSGPQGQVTGNRNTYYESSIGIDPTSNLPALILGSINPIFATLQSTATAGATSISTDKYIPTGSSVQLESGNNSETVTVSANSTGLIPTFTTTTPAITNTHSVGTAVIVTPPSSNVAKFINNRGTVTLPTSIIGTNYYFSGQTAVLQQSSSGVITTGGSLGTGKGAFKAGTVATGSRPSASSVGQGAQMFDTTLNKPIWSTGSGWVDATGASV